MDNAHLSGHFFYVLSRRPGQATDASAMRPYLLR